MSEPIEIDDMVIECPTVYDGYRSRSYICGTGFPLRPESKGRYEKKIRVECLCDQPVRVIVTTSDREGIEDVITYLAKNFKMRVGDLLVETRPNRNPCNISMGFYEPRARSLCVDFEEGRAVWVELVYLPIQET